MPSPAYDQWTEYVSDAVALQRLRQVGCTRVAHACVSLTEIEVGALGRAVLVALSAAFERYIVELFRVAASESGRSRFWAEEALRDPSGDGRRFANPSAPNVRGLFGLLFHEEDVWAGITTALRSEEMVQVFVDEHLQHRHDVAHGRDRPSFDAESVGERIQEFEKVVQSLDAGVGRLVRHVAGRCTWNSS